MKIGIIRTSNIGGLGRRFVQLGHQVRLTQSRGRETCEPRR